MLELIGIECHRAGLPILSNFSAQFIGGDRRLILGANGVGKTTLLELCCGLLEPSRGAVVLNGSSLSSGSMQEVAYAPELPFTFTELSVLENLQARAAMLAIDQPKLRVQAVIEDFDLQAVLRKKTHELSRGFKKRLSLALSFLAEPSVLLCDEPTTGLDEEGILTLQRMFKSLPITTTCIVVTHEPEVFSDLGFLGSLLSPDGLSSTAHPSSINKHSVPLGSSLAAKGEVA